MASFGFGDEMIMVTWFYWEVSNKNNPSCLGNIGDDKLPSYVRITIPKFNSSPLKSYLPNRKGVFQPPFFRVYVKLSGIIKNHKDPYETSLFDWHMIHTRRLANSQGLHSFWVCITMTLAMKSVSFQTLTLPETNTSPVKMG